MLTTALALLLSAAATTSPQLPLRPCTVQQVPARCGMLAVPENPDFPHGRSLTTGQSAWVKRRGRTRSSNHPKVPDPRGTVDAPLRRFPRRS